MSNNPLGGVLVNTDSLINPKEMLVLLHTEKICERRVVNYGKAAVLAI